AALRQTPLRSTRASEWVDASPNANTRRRHAPENWPIPSSCLQCNSFFEVKLRLRPQIQDVHLSPQARIVGKIPARMLGIVIEHDLVRIPQQAIQVGNIVGRPTEEKSADAKTAWGSAFQPPDVSRPNAAFEVPMLPRMVQLIATVIAPGMPHPLAVGMHVGRI